MSQQHKRIKKKPTEKSQAQIEQDAFNALTSNKLWLFVRSLAVVSVCFGVLALVDYPLPNKSELKEVVLLEDKGVVYEWIVHYPDSSSDKIEEEAFEQLQVGDKLSLEHSPILKEFYGYKIVDKSGRESFVAAEEFTVYYMYPLFPLLFLLPLLLFVYKKQNAGFYLLYFATVFLYPIMLMHYLFIEGKFMVLVNAVV